MSVRASSVDGMDAPTPSTGPQGPVVTREPRTHDFGPGSRAWGHDYTITKVIDGGRRLHVTGWGPSMEVGDFILLANGARASRYRIAEYEPVMGVFVVDDMWRAVLDFAPRQYATQQEKDATR